MQIIVFVYPQAIFSEWRSAFLDPEQKLKEFLEVTLFPVHTCHQILPKWLYLWNQSTQKGRFLAQIFEQNARNLQALIPCDLRLRFTVLVCFIEQPTNVVEVQSLMLGPDGDTQIWGCIKEINRCPYHLGGRGLHTQIYIFITKK